MVVFVEDGETVISVFAYACQNWGFISDDGLSIVWGENVLCVSVCGVRNTGQRCKVVQPVQAGLVCDGVDTSQQEVDIVGLPRSQAICQFATDKMRKC